ncbi:MAG TPA: xanthine dehydrogenase family protein subunit M [Trebonia sp.]|nr:xanthine dehydrogenase family protein subunit M [Trebonia sp.]
MKPPRFAYHAPTAVEEATGLLADYNEDAKVLAGGQSLIPLLSFRLAAPGHLIDINRLPGLDQVERTGNGWRIGALVRQRTAERSAELAAAVPLLARALAHVAHPQIRNRGTICGSLAHGDSSAELPAVMTALDARMTLVSAGRARQVAAGDFFQFHLTTAIEPDELLTAVEFDSPAPRTHAAFEELALRRGDFALAGVAASVTFAADGQVERCRVVAAGVAPTPLRLAAVEQIVAGSRLAAPVLAAAREAAYREVSPTGDSRADRDYRRHLLSVLVRRALCAVRSEREDDDES